MRKKIRVREDLAMLIPKDGIAIELGVAAGSFSHTLLDRNRKFKRLYSVDRWSGERGHNNQEYAEAAKLLRPFGVRSIVLRLEFDKAEKIFPASLFDLIYLDGYAHQGEGGMQTLVNWWQKLKPGGVFAGHDYDRCWPAVCGIVDEFAKENRLELHVTEEITNKATVTYPSWYLFKPGG